MNGPSGTARRRFNLAWLVWLAVPLLLWWALRGVRLAGVGAALGRLSPLEIAILVALNLLVMLTFSGRWWIILRVLGHPIPYLTLARYRLVGFAISFFTPGPHLGGEPVQVWLAGTRHDVPMTTATASVGLDKLIEVTVNFAFLAAGVALTLHSRVAAERVGAEAIWLAAGLLALPVAYLVALWQGRQPATWLAERLARRAESPRAARLREGVAASEAQAAQFARQHPAAIGGAVILSLASWAGLLVEYWLAYHYLGLTLPPMGLINLMTAARIAYLLPLPGGLGSVEASQAWMLGVLGHDPALGLSLSVLSRVRDLAAGGLGLWWGLVDFNALRVFSNWTPEPKQDKVT